jgi:hypothetical protein
MYNVSGFVGSSDQTQGLGLDNANLALAVFNESHEIVDEGSVGRQWLSLHADVGSAGLVGLDGISAVISDTRIGINQAASDGSVVDFALTDTETSATEFVMAVGSDQDGDEQLVGFTFDGSDGEVKQISGDITLEIDGYLSVEGGYSLTQQANQMMLVDEQSISTENITIALQDASLMAGTFSQDDEGNSQLTAGISIEDADLALALFSEQSGDRKWSALQSDLDLAELVGVDGIDLALSELSLEMNRAATDGSVIDFDAMVDAGTAYSVVTGADLFGRDEAVLFSFDAELGDYLLLQGNLDLQVSDFVYVGGGFSFQAQDYQANVDDQLVDTSALMFGLSDVELFAGVNYQQNGATGIEMTGVDLALVILNEDVEDNTAVDINSSDARQWVSVIAEADSAGVVAELDLLNMSLSNLELELNLAAADGSHVNYLSNPLQAELGPDSSVSFDMAGQALRVAGDITLELDRFVYVSGQFGFEQADKYLKLTDGSEVMADALVFSISEADIFAGINYQQSDQLGLSLTHTSLSAAIITHVSDEQESRQWVSIQADGDSVELSGISGITLNTQDLQLRYNSAVDGVSINFSDSDDTILYDHETGDSENTDSGTGQFDMSGEMLLVAGAVELVVADFFSVEGRVEFVQQEDAITLSDGSSTDVNTLAIVGYDLSAFAGLNGNTDAATGFTLTNTTFALAMMAEKNGQQRSWRSLQASVGEVGFIGADDLSITGQDLHVRINQGAIGEDGHTTVVDFSSTAMEFTNTALDGSEQFASIDIDGNEGAFVELQGHLDLDLFGFYQNQDEFSVRLDLETLQLSDGDTINGSLLQFVRSDLSANVGLGSVGFAIEDVDFGLAIISDGSSSWASLRATAAEAGFYGLEGVTITSSDIDVMINTGAFTLGVDGVEYDAERSIDYSASEMVLSDSIVFDEAMDRELYSIRGDFDLDLYNFIQISGELSFDKSTQQVVLQSDSADDSPEVGSSGEEITLDRLAVSALDIDAFAGLAADDYRLGFEVNNLDFGLVMLNDRGNENNRWLSVSASAEYAGLVGVDGLVVEAENVSLLMNQQTGEEAIDFIASDVSIGDLSFDFNEANTSRIAADMDINLFGLYSTSDYYSFDKVSQSVVFADGSTGNVDLLTLGGHVDSVFAGVNKDTDQAIGFEMNDAGFGIALAIDSTDPGNFWVTAQASAEETGFIGLDNLGLQADDIQLVINTASNDGRVIDYSAKTLDITYGLSVSGNGTSDAVAYTLDAQGDESMGISVGYGELDIAGAVQVIGALDIQKGADIQVDLDINASEIELLKYPSVIAQAVWQAIQEGSGVSSLFDGSASFKDVLDVAGNIISDILSMTDTAKAIEELTNLLQGIDLNTLHDVTVSTLTIGAGNVNVFAGLGGYFRDSNGDGRIVSETYTDADGDIWLADEVNTSASGFVLNNVGMGLGIFTELDTSDSYLALDISADEAGLVGMDALDLYARGIDVVINTEASGKVINFEKSFDEGYQVPDGTGNGAVLNESVVRTGVSVEQGLINLGGFASLQGSFAFDMGETLEVDISTGLGDLAVLGDQVLESIGLLDLLAGLGLEGTNLSHFEDVPVSVMTVAATGIEVFAGVGGPYKQDFNWDEDSNGDGNFYNDYYYNTGAIGLALSDVDFALAIMKTEMPVLDLVLDQFMAASFSAGFAGMVGVGEDVNNNGIIDTYIPQDLNGNGIRDVGESEFTLTSEDTNGNGALDASVTLNARDISFSYNTGAKWGGVMGPAVIDFASSFRDFTEDSNGNGVLDDGEDLDFDGEIDTAAYAINAGNGVQYIDFDSSELRVDVGYGEMSFADFLSINGSFSFSQVTNQQVVIDTGDLGELIAPLADVIGGDSSQMGLQVDMLTISATDVYGFAGINGTHSEDTNSDGIIDHRDEFDSNATGLAIQDADIAVALSTPSIAQIPGLAEFIPSFLSVKASVHEAGLIGTDAILTANMQDVAVNINTLLPPTALLATGAGAAVYAGALAAGALPSIDFAASFAGEDLNNNGLLDAGENTNGTNDMGEEELNRGLLVNPNSDNPFYLDFDSEIIEIKGYAEMSLLGAYQLSGGFSLAKTIEDVTFYDVISNTHGEGTAVALSLAISDAYGFYTDPKYAAVQTALRTALYGYEPSYWKDVNGDGKVTDADGGVHIDHPIVGAALEGFSAGIILMRQTGLAEWQDVSAAKEVALNTSGLINLYAGITSSVESVSITGIPGATLAFEDFALDANISVNPFIVVDFSRSGENRQGLTLDIAAGIDVDFSHLDSLQISFGGQGVVSLLDVVQVDASFVLSAGTDGLTVFANGSITVGTDDLGFNAETTGLLALNERGLAMSASFNSDLTLPGDINLDAEMGFALNTMGSDYTYVVPDEFVNLVGFNQVTVSATPPNADEPADAYAKQK